MAGSDLEKWLDNTDANASDSVNADNVVENEIDDTLKDSASAPRTTSSIGLFMNEMTSELRHALDAGNNIESQAPDHGKNIETQIDKAVKDLCSALSANMINFFDRSTLQDDNIRLYGVTIAMIPTGTYGCGVWRYGEEIHLVAMSDNSPRTFFAFVREALSIANDVKPKTDYGSAAMELSDAAYSKCTQSAGCVLDFARLSRKDQASCKFFLRYCSIPHEQDMESITTGIIPAYTYTDTSTDAVSMNQKANLIAVRDMQQLSRYDKVRAEPTRRQYIHLYRVLRYWAKARGLISPKLGFLDSTYLIWLARDVHVEEWSLRPSSVVDDDGKSLLAKAFTKFSSEMKQLDMSREERNTIRNLHHDTVTKARLLSDITPEAKQAVETALERSSVELITIDEITNRDQREWFRDFLDDFDYFFKVDCECWASSLEVRAEFQEIVVPGNINKVVTFFRDRINSVQYGNISLRVWPIAIVDTNDQKEQVYAIGIRRSRDAIHVFDPCKKKAAHIPGEIMEKVLDYDPNIGLISISLATSHDFQDGTSPAYRETEQVPRSTTAPPSTAAPLRSSIQATKFRSARGAISRLRFDPKHSELEYDVGYDDRFSETLLWMPLENWGGKETEDMDFIPEHRVRQLRRRTDGVVVWDRANRVDMT